MKESRKKLLKGIVTAAAAAGAVYGMNRLVFFLSTMKDLLTSKEKSYYNWRFGDIYYARKGEGRPVLLLHQLSASGSDCEWQSMIDELRRIIRFIRLIFRDAADHRKRRWSIPIICMCRQ